MEQLLIMQPLCDELQADGRAMHQLGVIYQSKVSVISIVTRRVIT